MVSDIRTKYLNQANLNHRQEFGQFFTDPVVASFMAKWVQQPTAKSVLDPAFGLGAFWEATSSTGDVDKFIGIEKDALIYNFYLNNCNSSILELLHQDYLMNWGLKSDAIICNPPYLRFQKFIGRDIIAKSFLSNLGIKLSGYTNIASAFLIKSISELNTNGKLAYIMPLEFLNTGYGKLVKQYLLESGQLAAIIKFNCEKEVFPDATTSVGIILFEKKLTREPIKFHVANTLNDLSDILQHDPIATVSMDVISSNDKWLKYFSVQNEIFNHEMLCPIGRYGRFSRGIATGANEFFVLTPEQARDIQIPQENLAPCITKSSQIRTPFFGTKELDELRIKNSPIYLLNVNNYQSLSTIEYLNHGKQMNYHMRFLTKKRNPWFKIETRQPAPILFGVFSRDGFKVIRNHTKAINLTCYHGFYPNRIGSKYVDHLFLFLISRAGRIILSKNMRQYGKSLDKFEPNDLNHALCPSPEWMEQLSPDNIIQEIDYVKTHGNLSKNMDSFFSRLIV